MQKDKIQAYSSSIQEQPLLNSNLQPINLLQTNKPTAPMSSDGLVNQILPFGALDKHLQSRGNLKHILATWPSATIQSFWVDHYQQTINLQKHISSGYSRQDNNYHHLSQSPNFSCKPNVTNKQELSTNQSFWVDRYQQTIHPQNQDYNYHHLSQNLSCKPNVTNKQELSNFQNMNINSFSTYPTNVNHTHLSTFKHRYLHSQREIVSKPGSSIDLKPTYQGKNRASL